MVGVPWVPGPAFAALGNPFPTGCYAVPNVGSGYAWFTSLSEGLALPIDEYQVRKLDE